MFWRLAGTNFHDRDKSVNPLSGSVNTQIKKDTRTDRDETYFINCRKKQNKQRTLNTLTERHFFFGRKQTDFSVIGFEKADLGNKTVLL